MSLKIKLTIILFIILSAIALGVVGVYSVLDIDFVITGDIVYKVTIKDESQYSQFTFTYDTENFTASVGASSKDLSGEIEIPSKVMHENQVYTVNAISENGFKDTQITKVTLPDTITTLNLQAFNTCVQLESINLPRGISEIPTRCFTNCMNLKSIDLSYIETIGVAALGNCGITDLVIPANVTTIYQSAFLGSGIKTLKILGNPTWANSNSTSASGTNYFAWCEWLESVDLGESLTIIPQGCFASCTSLKEVIIPASMTSISSGAFSNCTSLTTVDMKALKSILPIFSTNAIPLNTGLQIIVPKGALEGFKQVHAYYRNYYVEASE